MASYLREKNVSLEGIGQMQAKLKGSDEPQLADKGFLMDMRRTDVSFRLPFGLEPNGMRATRVNTIEVSTAVLERDFVDVSVEALGGGDPGGLLERMFGGAHSSGCSGLSALGLE